MHIFEILLIILPVFIIIILGAAAALAGWIELPHIDGLMAFSQGIAIPCLLFGAMVRIDLAAFDHRVIGSFYAATAMCFVMTMAISVVIFKQQRRDAVGMGFSAMYSNALLLGVPITQVAFGASLLPTNFAIIAFQAPIGYVIGITAMQFAQAGSGGSPIALARTIGVVVRQPHVLAIAAGLCFNLLGVALPGPIAGPIAMVGGAALPVALVGLGGMLTRYDLRGSMRATGLILVVSLLVSPGVTWGLLTIWGDVPEASLRAAVVTAAMAPGINSYLFAHGYSAAKEAAASAIVIGTALSIFSATIWIALLTR